MRAIKKPNSIRTIRYIGSVAGLLFGLLELYIVFTVDLNIVLTGLFAPLSMLYVPEALVGRVEVVGGIWILLVTWAALLAGRHPRRLNYLGVVVGVAGVLTVVPALEVLGIGFRLGEIVWIVWLGIVWFRGSESAAARKLRAFYVGSGVFRREVGRRLKSSVKFYRF
jgi:drug/metabolite transporter superfamily protein YnfA